MQMGGRDVWEVSVGPFTLDVRLAEELGWTESEIKDAATAMRLLSRGCTLSASLRSGRACEHCGGSQMQAGITACEMCGRKDANNGGA